MRIIIDGYNLLHVAQQWGDVKGEKAFIAKIIQYKKKKKHDIIIVFDGGSSPFEFEHYQHNILIIYSGYAQNADTVIINWLKQQKTNQHIVVVTSDAEIRDAAYHDGIPSLDSESFYKILLHRLSEVRDVKSSNRIQEKVIKLTTANDPWIDAILVQASSLQLSGLVKDADSRYQSTVGIKKGGRLSKEDKMALQIIEKL